MSILKILILKTDTVELRPRVIDDYILRGPCGAVHPNGPAGEQWGAAWDPSSRHVRGEQTRSKVTQKPTSWFARYGPKKACRARSLASIPRRAPAATRTVNFGKGGSRWGPTVPPCGRNWSNKNAWGFRITACLGFAPARMKSTHRVQRLPDELNLLHDRVRPLQEATVASQHCGGGVARVRTEAAGNCHDLCVGVLKVGSAAARAHCQHTRARV